MKEFTIPEGMRDLVLDSAAKKSQLGKELEACFASWGYEQVMTPTIEYLNTYDTGFEGTNDEDLYKFFDAKGRILVLRSDMTIPIARLTATKFSGVKPPYRFFYNANVFKVQKEFGGLQNELSDCGVELIGEKSECATLEILSLAFDALKVLESDQILLEIGDVSFFEVAAKALNIEGDVKMKLSELIDKKQLKDLEIYLNSLRLEEKYKEFFMQLPWLNGDESILLEAKKYAFSSKLEFVVDNMIALNKNLKELGYTSINYDLGKIRNINYYTGIIFEAYAQGVGTRILSGGSYNKLLAKYGGNALDAIGFSIKLDALLDTDYKVAKTRKMEVRYPTSKSVEAIKKANELRAGNVVTLVNDEMLSDIEVKEVEVC